MRPAFNACENLNHRRTTSPVAYCPECGGLVNRQHTSGTACEDARHALARRQQNAYCVHCGQQLIRPR